MAQSGRIRRGVGGLEARGGQQRCVVGGHGQLLVIVIPGWSEGPDPESRDSGFALRAPRNDALMFHYAPSAINTDQNAALPDRQPHCKGWRHRCVSLQAAGCGGACSSMVRAGRS